MIRIFPAMALLAGCVLAAGPAMAELDSDLGSVNQQRIIEDRGDPHLYNAYVLMWPTSVTGDLFQSFKAQDAVAWTGGSYAGPGRVSLTWDGSKIPQGWAGHNPDESEWSTYAFEVCVFEYPDGDAAQNMDWFYMKWPYCLYITNDEETGHDVWCELGEDTNELRCFYRLDDYADENGYWNFEPPEDVTIITLDDSLNPVSWQAGGSEIDHIYNGDDEQGIIAYTSPGITWSSYDGNRSWRVLFVGEDRCWIGYRRDHQPSRMLVVNGKNFAQKFLDDLRENLVDEFWEGLGVHEGYIDEFYEAMERGENVWGRMVFPALEPLAAGIEIAARMHPTTGWLIDVQEAYTGHDAFRLRKLGAGERAFTVFCAAMAVVPAKQLASGSVKGVAIGVTTKAAGDVQKWALYKISLPIGEAKLLKGRRMAGLSLFRKFVDSQYVDEVYASFQKGAEAWSLSKKRKLQVLVYTDKTVSGGKFTTAQTYCTPLIMESDTVSPVLLEASKARELLALPTSNSGQKVWLCEIDPSLLPDGVVIQGKAKTKVGDPDYWPNAKGSGVQIYVPNPDALKPIRKLRD